MTGKVVLKPVSVRYKGRKVRLYFRGDAAFALAGDLRIPRSRGLPVRDPPSKESGSSRIGHAAHATRDRPPKGVLRYYASFSYQAGSCRKRRVVAKVEWHPEELVPRVGFIVTNLSHSAERVTWFYNQRGKAEQYIKDGKNAIKWTRLSCRKFATMPFGSSFTPWPTISPTSCGRWLCRRRSSTGH